MNNHRLLALLLLAALPVMPAVMASDIGLIGHYTFDVDASDASSSSNHGELVDAVIVPGGPYGNACEFDGSNSYVRIPHLDAMAQPSFTVSAWAKSRDPNAAVDRGVFGKHREHDNISYHWLYQHGTQLQATMVGNIYGQFKHVVSPGTPVIDQWGMVTLTFDGGIMTLYVNGTPVGQQSVPGYGGNTYDLLVGAGEWSAYNPGPQRWWDGWIDDVRIYDRALGAAEVLALYGGDTNQYAVFGSIACTLGPQGALDAGAAWRLASDPPETWRLSGSIADQLPLGVHGVVFREVDGWIRPASREITIDSTGLVNVAATYLPESADGLVLHFDFDQATFPFVEDVSGHHHTGVVVGAVQVTNGYSGWAYDFDGASSHIRVASTPALQSTQFTVMAWAQSRDPAPALDRGILGKHREHNNANYYWLHQYFAELRGTMVGSGFGDFKIVSGPVAPLLDQWGHVALSYDGTLMSLYLNGSLVGQDVVPGYKGNGYDLLIGAGEWAYSMASPQRWWQGLIDEVRVYRRALEGSEIAGLYEGLTNSPPPTGVFSCTITPPGAVEAGASWRLASENEETAHASGYVIDNLAPGSYEVVFTDIPGWDPPPTVPVTVLSGKSTNITGRYTYASTNRLVLYFPFDAPPSGPVMDESGYGNHGYASNVVFEPSGYLGGCFAFNGSNAFVVVPDDDTYDTRQFTISAWAKTREAAIPTDSLDRGILGKHRQHYNTMYYWVYQRTNQIVGTMIADQVGVFQHVMGPVTPLYDAWGMVTLTYDQTNMALYINGAKVDEEAMPNYTGNGYDLLVGAGEWTMSSPMRPQRWWNGWIDEVRIYSYAMNPDEVATLYSGEAPIDVVDPVIVDIQPPNRHVSTAGNIQMMIRVIDNIGVADVTVNGTPADPKGQDRWSFHAAAPEPFSNRFVVVARDAAGNSTTQEVWYYRGSKLKLDALWDGMWEVKNNNGFDVPYTWDVFGQSEAGERTAPAHGKDRFETSVGPKTVRVFVDGLLQDMQAWNPRPKLVTAPVDPAVPLSRSVAKAPGLTEEAPSAYGNLSWNSVSSQVYRVYYAWDLMDGNWMPVPGAEYSGNGSPMVHEMTVPFTSHIFYLLEVDNVVTNQ